MTAGLILKSGYIEKNNLSRESWETDIHDERPVCEECGKIMLENFSTIKEKPYLQRVSIILKYRLFKYGMIRNIGLLLKI